MDAIWIAVIVGFTSIFGPSLLAYLNAKQARRTQEMNYEREDAVAQRLAAQQEKIAAEAAQVAEQAGEAARLLAARQDAAAEAAATTAQLLLEANAEVAATTKRSAAATNGQLTRIEKMVDGALTAALTGELWALEQLALHLTPRDGGAKPAQLTDVEGKITEVRSKLADRAHTEAAHHRWE